MNQAKTTTFLDEGGYACDLEVRNLQSPIGKLSVQVSTRYAAAKDPAAARVVWNVTLTQDQLRMLVAGLAQAIKPM